MPGLRLTILLSGLLLVLQSAVFAQHPRYEPAPDAPVPAYDPYTIVVKLKAPGSGGARFSEEALLQDIGRRFSLSDISKVADWQKKNRKTYARRSTGSSLIDRIYKLRLQDKGALKSTLRRLRQMDEIAYAEPYYLLQPLSEYVPDDPAAAKSGGAQTYLSLIKAYEAWGITRGDSSICIGILDTGVELGHRDLADNLLRNNADPLNGLDDDGDGYKDNFSGWDFADGDNDPSADQNFHGHHVSGLASATTDNGTGMAGTGFYARFMPLKIFRSSDGTFNRGYEAVAYAADMGCQVINLSWGGANAWSQFGQDMINYAVLEKDAVVVAAAGNSNSQEDFYPASFDHVLSVGFTDAQDRKASESTFSYFVDLVAPGVNLHTTGKNDAYITASGSSFASPLVAGTAALMRARFPQLSARQIMEKLRLSTDDIYNTGNNADFAERLGRGRLNMLKAVSELNSPAIRLSSFSYRNLQGNFAFQGDTLSLTTELTNYLSPASGVKFTLSSPSPHVSLLDSIFTLTTLDSLQTLDNSDQPFRLVLSKETPALEQLYFRLGIEAADGYTDYQYFYIVTEPEYTTLDNGLLHMPLHSDGRIGYGNGRMPLLYAGDTLATSMGFVLAAGRDSVSDNSIRDLDNQLYSTDFDRLERIRYSRSKQADILLTSVFDDNTAQQPIGLQIEQSWLSDTTRSGQEYLISEYRIVNRGSDTLLSYYPAVYADWHIGQADANRADWDAAERLIYAHDGNRYAGLALLSEQQAAPYTIDKKSLNTNTADLGTVFSDSLRYAWLSNSTPKTGAGLNGSGNDVATLLGAVADSLAPQRGQKVAFAWVAAATLAELQEKVRTAREHYRQYRENPPLAGVFYACPDSTATVQPGNGTYRFYRDPLGEDFLAEDSLYLTGSLNGDTSLYFTQLQDGFESDIQRLGIRMLVPTAAIGIQAIENGLFRNDTLFLNSEGSARISFDGDSTHTSGWVWTFDNGFSSTQANPSVTFDAAGTYRISLSVRSKANCPDTVSMLLHVVRRSPVPLADPQTVCYGSPLTLKAENTTNLAFFADPELQQLLGRGSEWVTDPLLSDSVFYLVNEAGTYASAATEVPVNVLKAELGIAYQPDTSMQSAYLLRLWVKKIHQQNISELSWQVNGQAAGSGDTILYDYRREHANGSDLSVSLDYRIAEAGRNCVLNHRQLIPLRKSPEPVFSQQRVCRGQSFLLQPQQSDFSLFYADAGLDRLIFKGKAMPVSAGDTTRVFYVSSLDSLLESRAVPVEITFKQFADFTMSSDTLILAEAREVTFEAFPLAEGDREISWNWDLGDGQSLNGSRSISRRYDSAGVYDITLVAVKRDGCSNTITKKLLVKTVSGLEENPEDQALRVFPNPNRGIVRISNLLWNRQEIILRFYDSRGRALGGQHLLYDGHLTEVDLNRMAGYELPEGVYWLSLQSGERNFFRKLIIHR